MKIAICDDSSQDTTALKRLIEEHRSGCEVSGEYDSAARLLEDYAKGARYDLLFLDIQMEGTNGYIAAQKLRELYAGEMPLFVFTTITNRYVNCTL